MAGGYKPDQIIRKLRQAEVLFGQGKSVEAMCREPGISNVTYYKWRKAYGGMEIGHAKPLKGLAVEKSRLKRVVAGLTLDNQILKDVTEGKL